MYQIEHTFIHISAKLLFIALVFMPQDTTRRQLKQETKIDCVSLEQKVQLMNAMLDTMWVQANEAKYTKSKNK